MAIVKVEALIKCQTPTRDTQSALFEVGDIIIILPAGVPWGRGDLQGKTIVKMELDLPYGDRCITTEKGTLKFACSTCDYPGIDWGDKTEFSVGDKAPPKIACPKLALTAPDMEFEFYLDQRGSPHLKKLIHKKRRAKVDIASVVSKETLDKIQAETECSESEKIKRLEDARKSVVSSSLVQVK